MHADMLHLAERLVIALESMSQDMKNMSAYVYDISYYVSYFVNKERDKGDISQLPSDESIHVPCGAPATGQSSPRSEAIWKTKQPSGSSFSHVAELQHQTTPAVDVASTGIDCSENADGFSTVSNRRIQQKLNSPALDENYRGNLTTCDVADKIKKENCISEERNTELYSPATVEHEVYSEEINRLDIMEMSFQEKFLKMPCSSESGTVLFQNLLHQKPFTLASCSTVGDTMGRESVAGLCFSKGRVEEEVEHASERKYTDQSGSVRARGSDVTHALSGSFPGSVRCSEGTQFERRTEGSALSDSLSERSGSNGRKKAIQCSICQKTFSCRSELIYHMRVQTGERPFKCTMCGKSFRTSGHKTEHMRIHTGEKPFRCNLCGKEFQRSGQLTMHKRSHAT